MIESNSETFKVEKFLENQEATRKILSAIENKVQRGMNYQDIENLIMVEFKKSGVEKSWHPIKVRIDSDTLLNFRDKSNQSIKIDNGSLYFIDIGSVTNGYEGDFGDTFVFGKDRPNEDRTSENNKVKKLELINKCKAVFSETVACWKSESLTGDRLYDFAEASAKRLGLRLNLNMDGHRLGSYPHGVYYKGSLKGAGKIVDGKLWVLEIQVMCPDIQLGAFYEDIIF